MKISINFVPETERQKNMIGTTTIPIDPIDAYNKIYGFETFHPLVSVVDLSEAKQIPNHINFRYGVYSLWLKDGVQCALHYGRRQYNYQGGTIVSSAHIPTLLPKDELPVSDGQQCQPVGRLRSYRDSAELRQQVQQLQPLQCRPV